VCSAESAVLVVAFGVILYAYAQEFPRVARSISLKDYGLGAINMNNSVSVIAAEDGLERTLGQAVNR
jgi:hypothetical protein